MELDSQQVFPFLMFERQAEEAMALYTSAFADSAVVSLTRHTAETGGPEGAVMHAIFTVKGHKLMCIDSGQSHRFTPAFSVYVSCDSEQELDAAFARLSEGGQVLMPLGPYPFSARYVWLQDRFGVSWQLSLRGPETARQ